MMRSVLAVLQLFLVLGGVAAFRMCSSRAPARCSREATMSTPTTSAEVVNIARKFIIASSSVNFATDAQPFIADQVEFSGPRQAKSFGRKNYLAAFGPELSALLRAVPDLQVSAFGVEIDPLDPSTVWLKLKQRGTITGPLSYKGDVLIPNKKKVEFPVEILSLSFQGSVISRITRGYVVDRTTGNTGGLLGVDGVATVLGEGPARISTVPIAVAVKQFFSRNRKL